MFIACMALLNNDTTADLHCIEDMQEHGQFQTATFAARAARAAMGS